MKQQEVKEVIIGESTFYIRPFPAFTAANISGDLAKVVTPIIGGIMKAFNGESADITKMDESSIQSIAEAFETIDGEKMEKLAKKLLVDYKNVSVMNEEATNGEVMQMSMDIANEVFCADLQDMYMLCFEVIKLNFGSFFKKLGLQFGNRTE